MKSQFSSNYRVKARMDLMYSGSRRAVTEVIELRARDASTARKKATKRLYDRVRKYKNASFIDYDFQINSVRRIG